MTYNVPTIIEYGVSTDLIQGTCGWGAENAFLDKTNYFEQRFKKCGSVSGNCVWTDTCGKTKKPNECSTDNDC